MRERGGRETERDVTRRAWQVVMICHAFSWAQVFLFAKEIPTFRKSLVSNRFLFANINMMSHGIPTGGLAVRVGARLLVSYALDGIIKKI